MAMRWALAVPQPPPLMVKVVADRIARDGVKKLAYIGYSEAWGDFVYNGAKAAEKAGGLQVVTNERYARTDTTRHRASAEDRRRAARGRARRRFGNAGRAAAARARRARLQGQALRHAGDRERRFHPRRRQGGRGHSGLRRPRHRRRPIARRPLRQEDLARLPRGASEGERRRQRPTASRPTRSTPG